MLLNRAPRRVDDLCYNVVHHSCQCEQRSGHQQSQLASPDRLQASILAETGYGCPCDRPFNSQGNCANEAEWTACYHGQPNIGPILPSETADSEAEVKLDLITATAAVAGFSSILFGLVTNLPVCLG